MAPRWSRVAAVYIAGLLAGCTGGSITGWTTFAIGDLSPASLAQSGRGLALVAAGVDGDFCAQVRIEVATRANDRFWAMAPLMVVRGREPIAEVKLDAGEYHIVAFKCVNFHGLKVGEVKSLGEPDGWNYYKKSYATFTVQAGEIVNIGFLKLRYVGTSPGFNDAIVAKLDVFDWPEGDRARFKQQRPELYAHMTTRLMRVNEPAPPTSDQIAAKCAEIRKLKSEGKLHNLPPVCAAPVARPEASALRQRAAN